MYDYRLVSTYMAPPRSGSGWAGHPARRVTTPHRPRTPRNERSR